MVPNEGTTEEWEPVVLMGGRSRSGTDAALMYLRPKVRDK